MRDLQSEAISIIMAGIDAVKPDVVIRKKLSVSNNILSIGSEHFDLEQYRRIYVIGAGKASALMAREIENMLAEKIFYGVVSVKYGHSVPCRKIRILEAGHPVLDENGLSATSQILQVAEDAGEKDLIICLLSGGGSALLEKIPPGIPLEAVQKMFKMLLGSGANIEQINTVRKHLSLVKGGQLARAAYPAECVSLIISDVIGDPLESIASGPTSPDPGTFRDAWEVLERFGIHDNIPEILRQHFKRGLAGEIAETPKPGDSIFQKVKNIILANNFGALEAARQKARELDYNVLVLSSRIQGEAREVGKVLAGLAQELLDSNIPLARPACILLGGETTVTLRGEGKGGRNQELALSAFISMAGVKEPYLILSCGTDGTDGPTDAAGGMAFPQLWEETNSRNLEPVKFLQENNAYPFLEKTGGLIKTGPTGTNVMDIMAILVP
ncbi:MAG: glycerate kinase [Calditrichaeota bacterium]|nr:glycerate kinase [Calditrichota bacterium]